MHLLIELVVVALVLVFVFYAGATLALSSYHAGRTNERPAIPGAALVGRIAQALKGKPDDDDDDEDLTDRERA